jgi:SAM-dependent methyltransferase
MPRELDSLTSLTLKHLREQWWTQAFTEFLVDTLKPRAGKRILDVGCGTGIAEVSLSRLRLSQVKLFGVDLLLPRVREARTAARGMNAHALYAAADATNLPFRDGVFDSSYCVAVLQHVGEVAAALGELARVTRVGGHILAVEPDNSARYWFSSVQSGQDAFDIGRRFFTALSAARGESPAAQTGPLIPGMFPQHGIEPQSVHVFPVTVSHLGSPEERVWAARREAVQAEIARAPGESLRRLGADFLKAIDQYARDAGTADSGFVEIQNTMLFATVGRRVDPD